MKKITDNHSNSGLGRFTDIFILKPLTFAYYTVPLMTL